MQTFQKSPVFTVTPNPVVGKDPSMTISTNTTDREGDRVLPEGGDFGPFLKNPVLCWAHDYSALPIGAVTGLSVEPGKGIRATWRWLDGDPFAGRVKNAYEQGVVRGSSIGFIAHDSEPNGQGGRDITKWEMLELSLCPIPMNPDAVRSGPTEAKLKRFGLDRVSVMRRKADDLMQRLQAALRAAVEAGDTPRATRLLQAITALADQVPDEVQQEMDPRRGNPIHGADIPSAGDGLPKPDDYHLVSATAWRDAWADRHGAITNALTDDPAVAATRAHADIQARLQRRAQFIQQFSKALVAYREKFGQPHVSDLVHLTAEWLPDHLRVVPPAMAAVFEASAKLSGF